MADDHPPQDITDPVSGGSRVLSKRCDTCVFRPGNRMHLKAGRLQDLVADALARGGYVVCHDTLTYGPHPAFGPAVCRGFFDAYGVESGMVRLMLALGLVVYVDPPAGARDAEQELSNDV